MITIRKLGLVIASAALAAGGFAAAAGPASAATAPLHVTLSASSDGASAAWDAHGNPVLTPGTVTSSTFAQVKVSLTSSARPASAPSFTTDNYGAGSPRWYIQLSNSYYLFGYPAQLYTPADDMTTGPNWQVNGPAATACGSSYVTYAKALTCADPSGTSTVTQAVIVADGDQAAGTHDTLTNVQYGGATLQVQRSNVVVIKNRHSGKCLNEGAGVLSQYACDVAGTYASLRWQVATFADGTKYLESIATHQFAKDGTQGQQLSLTSAPSTFTPVNGGFFRFPNGLVMDVKAMSLVNHAQVIGWPLNSQDNQRWDFANAPA